MMSLHRRVMITVATLCWLQPGSVCSLLDAVSVTIVVFSAVQSCNCGHMCGVNFCSVMFQLLQCDDCRFFSHCSGWLLYFQLLHCDGCKLFQQLQCLDCEWGSVMFHPLQWFSSCSVLIAVRQCDVSAAAVWWLLVFQPVQFVDCSGWVRYSITIAVLSEA